jgi:hypothetical protein
MPQNRRSFLKTAGIATAVVSAAPLALSMEDRGLPGSPHSALAADKRAYTAGRFALELDGADMGVLTGYEGGFPYGEVVESQDGSEMFVRKHIGNVKYEEIRMQLGLGMDPAVYAWITAMLSGKAASKAGAIRFLDGNGNIVNRLEFDDALITEITFPALDGASKEAAYLEIVLDPGSTRYKTGSGRQSIGQKQKTWSPANYRLTIGDLPTKRVSKIEAFTIKQAIIQEESGDRRDPVRVPGKLEFPNLQITFPDGDSAPWRDWFNDFVIRGNNGDDQEKSGMLEYLASNLKTVIAQVAFAHLGIFKLTPEKVEAGSENIRRVSAELYVEQCTFSGPLAPGID